MIQALHIVDDENASSIFQFQVKSETVATTDIIDTLDYPYSVPQLRAIETFQVFITSTIEATAEEIGTCIAEKYELSSSRFSSVVVAGKKEAEDAVIAVYITLKAQLDELLEMSSESTYTESRTLDMKVNDLKISAFCEHLDALLVVHKSLTLQDLSQLLEKTTSRSSALSQKL